MPSFARRLEMLDARTHGLAERAAILAQALPFAPDDELPVLFRALLATGAPGAIVPAIAHAHRAGDWAFDAIARQDEGVTAGIARAIATRDRQAALNAIELVRRRTDRELAVELVDLLDSPHMEVAPAAAAGLLHLIQASIGRGADRTLSHRSRHRLDRALARAGEGYRRHRLEDVVVAAAMALPWAGPLLGTIIAQEDHPLTLALRGVPGRLERAAVRRNLLRWLGTPRLQAHAASAVHKLSDASLWSDFLADGHLLRTASRRRGLRRAARARQCLPALMTACTLPAHAQGHLPALAMALDLSHPQRLAALTQWIALPAPLARLQCLTRLMDHESLPARQAIGALCADRDPHVAAVALRHSLGAGGSPAEAGPIVKINVERGPALSRQAALMSASRNFDALFERWAELTSAEQCSAAAQLRAAAPERLVEGLRSIMTSSDHLSCLMALGLARRMRVAERLERALVRLIAHENARIAASAAAALAQCASPLSEGALRLALRYADARVRANAVEALAQRHRPRMADMERTMSESRDNRPRANAICGLLRHEPRLGHSRLRAMLGDDDPRHRVSAVWVARRSRARDMAADLMRLVHGDPHAAVRDKAAGALRVLSWRPGATTMQGAAL